MRLYHGLLHILYLSNIWHIAWIIQQHFAAVRKLYLIYYAWACGNKVQIEFPFKAFLNYFHVQQAQKAAAEAKAQRHGGFRLIGQRCVVKLELIKGVAQVLIVRAVGGIYAAEHHGVCLLIAGQSFLGGVVRICYGIAHLSLRHALYGGGYIAYLARRERIRRQQPRCEHAHLGNVELAPCRHVPYTHAGLYCTVLYPHIAESTLVVIVYAVEYERLKRSLGIAAGSRYVIHYLL